MVRLPSEEGSVPESVVSCKLMVVSAVRPRDSGIVPDIWVNHSCRSVSAVRRLKESGIVPDN
eukprot:SAG31_NODE_6834_length_1874_cov_91.371268_1_plen_62_part_00